MDQPIVETKQVKMQRVFIKFSTGKLAIFVGPAVFTSAELKLTPIEVTDIQFSEPYDMTVRVPKTTEASGEKDKDK